MSNPIERERWQRIEALVDQALDLPEERRTAFLREACAGDDALRSEIEALIAAGERADEFLRTSAQADARPERIGPYRLVRELGRGGMGIVYLAEREDFEHRVALKLVRPGLQLDPTFTRRFLEERQILARLDHPNIARLLDGGITDQGAPYFVLEYVDGARIDEYCAAHQLSLAQRLALLTQACDAVANAHARGIVHRDLKSSNILVTASGAVKLLDFGIARLISPDEGPAPAVTRTGERMLTPEYSSPEQLRGEPVNAASDVYALGIVMYEVLTSRRPFANARTPEQLLHAALTRDPPLPSTVVDSATAARRALRGDLDAIVLKALRQDSAKRYTDAAALAEDLRRHASGMPVEARGAARGYRVRSFARRHRVALSAGVAGLLGGLGIFALSTAGPKGPALGADQRVLAIGRIVDYRDSTRGTLDPLTDMLATNLARAPGLSVISAARMYELLRQSKDSDYGSAARLAGATELIEGSVYGNARGGLRLDLRRTNLANDRTEDAQSTRGSDLFALADSATTALLADLGLTGPPGSIADVTTRSLEAYRLYTDGLHRFFQLDSAGAGKLLDAALGADSNFAMAAYYSARTTGYNWRSAVASPSARNVFAQRVERALRLADRASDRERLIVRAWWARNHFAPELHALADTLVVRYPQEVEGHLNLGVSLLTEGDIAGGAARIDRAIALDSVVLAGASAGCAGCEALRLMTEVYWYSDSLPAAERVARRWVRLQPQSPLAHARLGETLDLLGRFPEGEQELQRAVAMDRSGAAAGSFLVHWLRLGEFARIDSVVSARMPSAPPPQRPRLLLMEILSLRHQGRLQEAYALARELRARAAEEAPAGAAPTSALAEAQVLFDQGQYVRAAALFDSISRREPAGLPPSVRAFLRVIALSQVATARAFAGDTLGFSALADSMQHDGARTLLSRTRVQHEYVRGLLLAARRDNSAAERAFTAALNPGKTDYTWPSYELGKLLLEEKRPADAVRVLQPAVRGVLLETANFHLTLTELHQRLAEAWDAAGQRDSAVVHYGYVVRALRRADPIWSGRRDAAQKRISELTKR